MMKSTCGIEGGAGGGGRAWTVSTEFIEWAGRAWHGQDDGDGYCDHDDYDEDDLDDHDNGDEFTWPRDLGSVAEHRCDGGNIVLNWYSYSGSENWFIFHRTFGLYFKY